MKKVFYIISISLLLFSGGAFASIHHNPLGLKNYFTPKDTIVKKVDADTTDDDDVKYRTYEIGLMGASDQSHYGLHSSGKIPYLEPSFTYTAKSGFYIEVSDQFILKKDSGGFDVFGLNPGWNIDLTDNTTLNFNYQFYYVRPKSPDLVRSSLFNCIETYIEQDLGDFEGKFSIDYDIYKAQPGQPKTPSDIVFSPDITYDHEFDFKHKQSLDIEPEASFDFGTRNMYTQYQNTLVSDSAANVKNYKARYRAANSNASFGTLDLSFVLTVEYQIGKFKIEPAVTYAYPLYHPSGLNNAPTFYGSITLGYKIKGKK
jgi:hypothetical protein